MVPKISSTTNRIFCHFRLFFALYPLKNLENRTFEKMKKTTGSIIILNMSNINENIMMYDSWDMEHDRQKFFSFWTIFCPFTLSSPLTTQRIKIFKKWKQNSWRYRHFTQTTIIWYMVSEIWSAPDRVFLLSWAILWTFNPLTAKKWKFQKNEKKPGDIIILHNCI